MEARVPISAADVARLVWNLELIDHLRAPSSHETSPPLALTLPFLFSLYKVLFPPLSPSFARSGFSLSFSDLLTLPVILLCYRHLLAAGGDGRRPCGGHRFALRPDSGLLRSAHTLRQPRGLGRGASLLLFPGTLSACPLPVYRLCLLSVVRSMSFAACIQRSAVSPFVILSLSLTQGLVGDNTVVVSPDAGGVARAKKFRDGLKKVRVYLGCVR